MVVMRNPTETPRRAPRAQYLEPAQRHLVPGAEKAEPRRRALPKGTTVRVHLPAGLWIQDLADRVDSKLQRRVVVHTENSEIILTIKR